MTSDVTFGRLGTMKSRIEAFSADSDDGGTFQSRQAKIAVARGGFTGTGPGQSRQKNILPQSSSDFIYAIITEEYGTYLGTSLSILYAVTL